MVRHPALVCVWCGMWWAYFVTATPLPLFSLARSLSLLYMCGAHCIFMESPSNPPLHTHLLHFYSAEKDGVVEFVRPPAGAEPGDRVVVEAVVLRHPADDTDTAAGDAKEGEAAGSDAGVDAAAEVAKEGPASANQMKKKKYWEKMADGLMSDSNGVAVFNGRPLVVGDLGACTLPTLVDAQIR